MKKLFIISMFVFSFSCFGKWIEIANVQENCNYGEVRLKMLVDTESIFYVKHIKGKAFISFHGGDSYVCTVESYETFMEKYFSYKDNRFK